MGEGTGSAVLDSIIEGSNCARPSELGQCTAQRLTAMRCSRPRRSGQITKKVYEIGQSTLLASSRNASHLTDTRVGQVRHNRARRVPFASPSLLKSSSNTVLLQRHLMIVGV